MYPNHMLFRAVATKLSHSNISLPIKFRLGTKASALHGFVFVCVVSVEAEVAEQDAQDVLDLLQRSEEKVRVLLTNSIARCCLLTARCGCFAA